MTGAGLLIYRRTCRGAANALPASASRHSYHPPVKTFEGRGVAQDHVAGVPGAVNGRPLIDRCRISKLRDGSMPRIAPTSVVAGEYLAGTPGVSGSADGTGSAARFYGPFGIAVDSANNLYVGD